MERRAFLTSVAGTIPVVVIAKELPNSEKPIRGKLRLWKLGSLDHQIYPSEQAINRLADILKDWDGKGDLDLIWGPEISCEIIDTDNNNIDVILPQSQKAEIRVTKNIASNIRIIEK